MRHREFSVLLISTLNAPFAYGCRILAAHLNNQGVKADLLFTRTERGFRAFSKRGIENQTARFNKIFLRFIEPYAVIGLSVYTDNLAECERLARLIKKSFPEKKIVTGAFHATVSPRECLQFSDFVCVGEGFIAFADFVKELRNESAGLSPLNKNRLPPGIWSNSADQGIIENGHGAVWAEMDRLPFPCFDSAHNYVGTENGLIVPLKQATYQRYLGNFYFTMMSFGCPMSCVYCGNSALREIDPGYTRMRWHSPEYIFREINEAKQYHQFSMVWFLDDAFISMEERSFNRFLDGYPREVGLPFYVSGIMPSVGYRYKERLGKLADMGMVRAKIGIQSGSETMLRRYQRPQNNNEVIELAAELSRRRIPAICDIIVDGVKETPADILATIELIKKIKRPYLINLFSLRVYPGTELAKQNDVACSKENRAASYRAYRPILGNFLLGMMNYFPMPLFFEKWLRGHQQVLGSRVPLFCIKLMSFMIFLKYQYFYITQKDYFLTPYWIVRLIRFLKKI